MDLGILAAPGFMLSYSEIYVSGLSDRKLAQGGIAIHALFELDIKPGSIMRVTASLSHFFGQIKLPRAGYTNVNLLQEYYVCLVMVDNLCNSFRSKEPVNADGPMHIVGKNPE